MPTHEKRTTEEQPKRRHAAGDSAHLVADQSAAAAFLENPASHAGASVQRIDTHAAMVFLAGDKAYKVKRAVKFPYMDFSTLALRERACKREIELNRRTAPQLYLAARPIVRARGGGLTFDGSGETIEWAVEMRRFDQDGLFDRLAERGALTPDLMAELTDSIVRFHAGAEMIDAHAMPRMGAESMRWVIEESLDEFTERPDLFEPDDVTELRELGTRMLKRSYDSLQERLLGGRVRRCHGDLHLRNICLLQGAPTLFDCIEFNEGLACIDVFYDLAFLLMDLDHRGLRGLANLVLNRYLQRTGDLSGLVALPLFLAARALIRAKVSASAEASQKESGSRRELRAAARDYLSRVRAYLAPQRPSLIAVGGLSGSGKSSLARALAPEIGAAPGALHLRSDVIRKEICGKDELDALPQSAYGAEMSGRVYEEILRRAEIALSAGHAVVADAVYARPDERHVCEDLADRLQIPFHGLWLEAGSDVLMDRVDRRVGDASDADRGVVSRQLAYDLGRILWRRIDAAGTSDDVLRSVLADLRRGSGRQHH